MVQGVGGLGGSQNTGSIKDLTEYQVYYPMYQKYRKENQKSTISFEAWLIMKGYMDYFTQKVENYIETSNGNVIDEQNGNTISVERHVSYGNNAVYQSQDEDTYYEFDYSDGSYRKIEGKEAAAKALGLPSENNIDTIKLGYQSAIITDYTFGNLDDGQDAQRYRVSGRYGNVGYTQQEFDIHYILNALLMDPSDPQYQIAKQCFDDLCTNLNQWLPISEQQELDEIAEKYGTNSSEYKSKLQEVILKNLDQANEWVEDHTHVANVNAGSLTELERTNGVQGSDETQTEQEASIPNYNQTNVLTTAGLLTEYSRNDKRSVESTNNSESNRRKELQEKMDADLETLSNALLQTLGNQATDEIKTYINQAVANTVADSSLISTWSKHHGFLGAHKKTGGSYNIKDVADKFFSEFNTLCANKGKSAEQVAAEKEAAEKQKEQEKNAYKTIYNMNMNSVAKEAEADKDIQVVNATSAAEIKAKAESSILQPLKNKIRSKLAGQGISNANLNTMLDNAATAALTDCTDWATTNNNVVYTIDASKLIDKFEENIKTIVKNRGYDF